MEYNIVNFESASNSVGTSPTTVLIVAVLGIIFIAWISGKLIK